MSDLSSYLWLIPALPLLASVLTGFFGPRLLRGASHWPVILAVCGVMRAVGNGARRRCTSIARQCEPWQRTTRGSRRGK